MPPGAPEQTLTSATATFGPERWRELSPYLDHALDLEATARATYLASLDRDVPLLAAHVRSLLAEHDALQASPFLEHALPPPLAGGPLEGHSLGAYRLVSNIGAGGMGSVWLAERSDGRFTGRAAIKLLNMALMAPAGQERFRREGDILARLSHPHIARLMDAGVSPAGQPYLVLEHIEGQRIDRYCDDRRLGVEARVRLFLHVLEAVAHAHANLVVHRDIKPPNVLVTTDGCVKLLDFGIAKLLDHEPGSGMPQPAAAGDLTREAGAGLTPSFAAPEQLTGAPITTATDVYALGILLYLLLTGRHPAGELRSTADLVRAVIDGEARRPSEAVASTREAEDVRAKHAANRGTTQVRLRRRLEGDLDLILGKALKKLPADRYASVDAFADDLRRSLAHQPISARPDGVWYRASSFVRRHRKAVAASTAMFVVIAGLTAFYTSRLATERDRARLEANKAARVSELLSGLLTGADPYATRETPGEPTVRGLLDAGADRLQVELADQPELRAEIMTVIGRVYQRLGLHAKAQPLLEQSLAIGRRDGRDHPRVAQSLNDLGVLMRHRGELTAAAGLLGEALTMRRRLFGRAHADVAVTMVELGRVHVDRGRDELAEPLFQAALDIRRQVLGPSHRNIATSMSDLGRLYYQRRDFAAAAPLLRECLAITRRVLAGDHPDVATALTNLAQLEQELGRHDQALPLLREAVAIDGAHGMPQRAGAAVTLHDLAQSLLATGRRREGTATLEKTLALARARGGDDHPAVALVFVAQARLALADRRPRAAEPLLRRAVQIGQQVYRSDDGRVGEMRSLLGATLTALGRYAEAEVELLEADRVLRAARGRRAREAPATRARLEALYEAWGRPDPTASPRS